MSDHALYVFGPRSERFARSGIKLVLNSRVKAVQDGRVTVVDKEGSVSCMGGCQYVGMLVKHGLHQAGSGRRGGRG